MALVTNKEYLTKLFFEAAHIAKLKNLFQPQDRKYLYKLGVFLNNGFKLTENQLNWGVKKVIELGLVKQGDKLEDVKKICSITSLFFVKSSDYKESIYYKRKTVEQTLLNGIIQHELFQECKEIFAVCIGTRELIGDALGPMVGSILKDKGLKNVLGTLNRPVDATNVTQLYNRIPKSKDILVIAVDAANGDAKKEIGQIRIEHSPLKPAGAYRDDLPKIGNISISMVTTVWKDKNMEDLLRQTPLEIIYKGAVRIANTLEKIMMLKMKTRMSGSF